MSRYISKNHRLVQGLASLLCFLSLAGITSCTKKTLSRETALQLVSRESMDTVRSSIKSTFDLEDDAQLGLYNSGILQCIDQQLLKCCYYYARSAECSPKASGDNGFAKNGFGQLEYIVGSYNASEVLGITQQDTAASAQIRAQFSPTPFFSKYKSVLEQINPEGALQPQTITYDVQFVRYDDGWRLAGKSVFQRQAPSQVTTSSASFRSYAAGDTTLNFDLSNDGGQTWRGVSLPSGHEMTFHNVNRFRITTNFPDGHTKAVESALPAGSSAYAIKLNPDTGVWDLYNPTGDTLSVEGRSAESRIALQNEEQANRDLATALGRRDAAGVEQALKNGANPNISFNPPQAAGQLALTWAAQDESPQIAELLIKAGANVNSGGGVDSPLYMAVYLRRVETFRTLYKAGLNQEAAKQSVSSQCAGRAGQDQRCQELLRIVGITQ